MIHQPANYTKKISRVAVAVAAAVAILLLLLLLLLLFQSLLPLLLLVLMFVWLVLVYDTSLINHTHMLLLFQLIIVWCLDGNGP